MSPASTSLRADDSRRETEVSRGRVRAEALAIDPRLTAVADREHPAGRGLGADLPEVVLDAGLLADHRQVAVVGVGGLRLGRDPDLVAVHLALGPEAEALDGVERARLPPEVDRVAVVLVRVRVSGDHRLRAAPADEALDDRARARVKLGVTRDLAVKRALGRVGTPAGGRPLSAPVRTKSLPTAASGGRAISGCALGRRGGGRSRPGGRQQHGQGRDDGAGEGCADRESLGQGGPFLVLAQR